MSGTNEVRVVNAATGGEKGSKDERFDLIPAGPLAKIARHFGIGARKYADRNWERGYNWSLSYGALQRHLNAFWAGEDLDEETQSPHLAAAAFHVLALLEFAETHPELDDRPGSATKVQRELEASLHELRVGMHTLTGKHLTRDEVAQFWPDLLPAWPEPQPEGPEQGVRLVSGHVDERPVLYHDKDGRELREGDRVFYVSHRDVREEGTVVPEPEGHHGVRPYLQQTWATWDSRHGTQPGWMPADRVTRVD